MAVENYTIEDITQHVQNVFGELFKQLSNFAGLIILGAIITTMLGAVYLILRFARGRR